MEMKLGKQIVKLRRAKGQTQEQLARAVGVSAPAVSKWETDSSCPDISLLCPLARALDTNVDTLLQFEENLSEEDLADAMNQILKTAGMKGAREAEQMLEDLLHEYPSSIPLKYQATVAINYIRSACEPTDEERQGHWIKKSRQLLEEVYYSGDSRYWQKAIGELAGIAVGENDLEKAEMLLKKLPEGSVDTTALWMQIHWKRNEPEEALTVVQKRLYVLANKVQQCLIYMMNEKMGTDADKMLELCKVYQQVEELFGIGSGGSAGVYIEAYQRMGNMEKVKEHYIKLIEYITGYVKTPNPLLFDPAVKIKREHSAMTKELKELALKGLMEEEVCQTFMEDEEFRTAVEKLRLNIEES